MAIDLAHLKTLPIIMYGQTYLLAVIAWLAAPLFAVFGPSIALLKAPFVPINLLTVGALYVVLRTSARLGVAASAIVSATIALPTVVLSQSFMNASGGHVEPVLYVPLLFLLRRLSRFGGQAFQLGDGCRDLVIESRQFVFDASQFAFAGHECCLAAQ